jgi:MFS family permease
MNLMIAFSAGQGFSGVMMNIIQFIVLGCVNTGNREKDLNITAWTYFGISAGCLLLILILLAFQMRTEFFKYYLKPLTDKLKKEKEEKERKKNSEENKNEEDKKEKDDKKEEDKTENKNQEDEDKKQVQVISTEREQQLHLKENGGENQNKEEPNPNNNNGPGPKKRRQISFFEMFKILMDLDILRTYINLISNAIFPNSGVIQSLFQTGKYKTVTILIMNNFMDFFGRYIVLVMKQTKTKTYIIAIGRTILVFLLIFNYYCEIDLKTDINVTSSLLIVYVLTLGLTHGMGNSLCFGLAPTLVEDDLKMQAGSSMSFFTVFGLFLGSCLGFLTKFILDKIKE